MTETKRTCKRKKDPEQQGRQKLINETLWKRIDRIRLALGLTARDIAKGGFYESHWRKMKSEQVMSLESLEKISEMLGVSISVLLNGIKPTRPTSAKQKRIIQNAIKAADSGVDAEEYEDEAA